MPILWLKALHIIFVVTWFAGLFYIVRLFIYQREAQDKPEPERGILTRQFKLMSARLWLGIAWPSAVLTLLLGGLMLWLQPFYLEMPWMKAKLIFVGLLFVYHGLCHRIYRNQQLDVYTMGSMGLRLWNELATVFLFAIVFLVVCKSTTNWLQLVAGLVLLVCVLVIGIKAYKRFRRSNDH
jgi:protoporphyrinogen IX oxidase